MEVGFTPAEADDMQHIARKDRVLALVALRDAFQRTSLEGWELINPEEPKEGAGAPEAMETEVVEVESAPASAGPALAF